MKSLVQLINEELSSENIKTIIDYIQKEFGTHSDAQEYINAISNVEAKKLLNNRTVNDFFRIHGLDNIDWGLGNSAKEYFINVFSKNNNLHILKEIIDNNGILKFNELENNTNQNIFSLCNINGNSFVKEAKIICSYQGKNNVNIGPGELLLRFILQDSNIPESGDIKVGDNSVEVKSVTISGKTISGGHACNNKQTRNAWSIYQYLNYYLFCIGNDNNIADLSDDLLKVKNKFTLFNDRLNNVWEALNTPNYDYENSDLQKDLVDYLKNQISDNNKKIDEDKFKNYICNTIINSILYQYYIINNSGEVLWNLWDYQNKDFQDLYGFINKYTNLQIQNNIISFETNGQGDYSILDLIGVCQLYLYQYQEHFLKIMFIVNDKHNIENELVGKYIILDPITDLDSCLQVLKFKSIDNTDRRKTGEMILREI